MATTDPPVHTQADLERLWRQLMEPLGFADRTIWLMLIEADGTPIKQLTQFGEPPVAPSARDRASVRDVLASLGAEMGAGSDRAGLRMAFLLSRPGRGRARRNDRFWAELLYAACRDAGLPCEVVHLATDDTLMALPPDELDLRGLGEPGRVQNMSVHGRGGAGATAGGSGHPRPRTSMWRASREPQTGENLRRYRSPSPRVVAARIWSE